MGCGASSKEKYKEDEKSDAPTTKTDAKDGKSDAPTTKTDAPTTKPDAETVKPDKAADAPAAAAPKAAAAPAAAAPEATAAPAAAAPEAAPDATAADASVADAPAAKEPAEAAAEDEDEDEDDEMDQAEAEEMFRRGSLVMHRKREGVMAENWAPDEGWEPPQIEKSDEQRERIQAALGRPAAFMFHALDASELNMLILAFKEHQLQPDDEVIQQGARVLADEPGLYVIESGDLDVYKTDNLETDAETGKLVDKGTKVHTYCGQGQFGELALLYNAPRAATVVAATECVVWSIDRNTFNHCVKGATARRAEKYEEFLAKVQVLESLAADERAKIADVLKQKEFAEGESIIQQGESGDEFYIVEEGSAVATKDGEVVKEYKPTDYFGELALISSSERRATVTAKETPTKVVSLERSAFIRLLGPLQDKLAEASKEYVGMEGVGVS